MSGLNGTIMQGLRESEIERLMRVAIWAFNQGRQFAEEPEVIEMFSTINWKTAKYPEDTGTMCFNCMSALINKAEII